MNRRLIVAACAAASVLGAADRASAQGVDLTLFTGRAFPVYDERLTLRPSIPSLPGVEITAPLSPELSADGGPVFGIALAVEAGVFGLEGRLDATDVGLDFTGARYELRGTQPPLQNVSASVVAAAGTFDADRISLLSLNARLRTPGPIGVVVSGGLSYLPDIRITGSVPIGIQASGVALPIVNARLVLRATPDQAEHRFGVNGGAGLRLGGRVALMAEARVFYFREFELRFAADDGPELLDQLLDGVPAVNFTPVFVNAQVGVVFRF